MPSSWVLTGGTPAPLALACTRAQGLKGAQISHTSLVAAIRQQASPSLIHSMPSEQGNQDMVSLGTHAALTASDATALLKAAVALHLLAAAQAIDLRPGGAAAQGAGTAALHSAVRGVTAFVGEDRALDADVAALVAAIDRRELPTAAVRLSPGG